MGFASGFQSGFSTASSAMKAREERRLKEQIGQEAARYGVTEGAYGQGLGENIQQVQGLQQQALQQAQYQGASEDELAAIEQQYAPSIAELQRRQGLTAPEYTIASRGPAFATRGEAEEAAKPMRTQGIANVYRQAGEVEKADEAEARAMQMEAAGLTLKKGRREEKQRVDFDTGYEAINKQKFDKPEERTAAILGLVESTQGVEARMRLENQYSQSELNKLTLQAKKFEDGFNQARAKGVTSAIEWFDEQNAAFKLERDPKNPFRIIQVNQDGSRSLFADAKNERELGMIVDAKAKPGGWLELAKYDLDVKKTDAAVAASRAAAAASMRERGVKPISEADITARAKALFESGEVKTFTEALQIARQGDAYISPVDRLIKDMADKREAELKAKAATTPGPAAAGPKQGLFRDPRGNVQLLQPMFSLGDFNRRLVEEQNARDAASGFGLGNVAP